MSIYWVVISCLGVVALGVVIAIAMIANGKHEKPAEMAKTERAAHELRDEIDRDDEARDKGVA